jgi:cation transport protein ChaC
MADAHDLWIFAYGSLMWRPGFEAEEVVHARLVGWRRSFCIYSRFHRGSDRRPGLVLGLDRGGMCEGIAFRVSAGNARQTLRYLREREQVGSVYREALVPVTLLTGERPG